MCAMQPILSRILIGGSLVLTMFGSALNAQLAPVKPGPTPTEANFFIATPRGWTQPKTAWGDPDLQGIWPISYVGTVSLQRCVPAFGARPPAGSPPCDPHKAFLTATEFDALQERAAKQPDRYANAVKDGEGGRAFLAGVMDVFTPQRQTSLIMDPPDGKLPEMTPEGKRLSSLMKSSWALPGEKLAFDSYTDFDSWDRCITRGLPASMFPFRYNNGLQIIQAPGYVSSPHGNDPRVSHYPAQCAPGISRDQGVARRFPRALGWKHSCRRNDELQAWCVGHQHRRRGLAAGEPFPDQRADENDGALHTPEQRLSDLRNHG